VNKDFQLPHSDGQNYSIAILTMTANPFTFQRYRRVNFLTNAMSSKTA